MTVEVSCHEVSPVDCLNKGFTTNLCTWTGAPASPNSINTSAFVGTDPTKCPQLPSDPSYARNCGFDVAKPLVKC